MLQLEEKMRKWFLKTEINVFLPPVIFCSGEESLGTEAVLADHLTSALLSRFDLNEESKESSPFFLQFLNSLLKKFALAAANVYSAYYQWWAKLQL